MYKWKIDKRESDGRENDNRWNTTKAEGIKSKSCIWAKPNLFKYACERHGVDQVGAEAEVRWV